MDKRNVLISGGTRGVGLAIARKLAADGYRVFALGRKESDDLTRATAQFDSGVMNFVPFDLSNVDGIPELVRELSRGGFEAIHTKPIHKRQGTLRFLHHECGLPYEWRLTRYLAAGLALITPGEFFGHMLFAAARKPANPV